MFSLNLSQVALVAINIIGDPADYSNDSSNTVSAKHPCLFTVAMRVQLQGS